MTVYNCDYCVCDEPIYAGDREEGYFCEVCRLGINPKFISQVEASFYGEPSHLDEFDYNRDITPDEALEIDDFEQSKAQTI